MTDAFPPSARLAYSTGLGESWVGDSLALLDQVADGSVDLVVTSPPFALQRQKEYGNEDQDSYIDWLKAFATKVFDKLTDTGSFVLDLGGAYKKGMPSRSLYNFRIPITFCDEVGFHLAQEFFWNNPSKLPSPIEWVNKRKIRVKDSVNTIWWFSKTAWPKADVTNVLVPYSDRMKKLLRDPEKYYSPKKRPSGHDIGRSFSKDNGGAIPSNLLSVSNSESNSWYLRGCKALAIKPHPARFPMKIPQFFIEFLTEPDDLVIDIFAGSNTTGEAAEALGRRWRAFDLNEQYVAASAFRFFSDDASDDLLRITYRMILSGQAGEFQSQALAEAAE